MPRVAPEMPDRLARCAFEVFAERGFRDCTVDDIAARAGVTKGSFYSHYRSKRAIVLAACNHYYRTYHQRVRTQLAGLVDPMQRLRCVVEHGVHTCVADRQTRVFTTKIFALSLKDEAVRAGWAQFYDTVRQQYVELVRAAVAAGELETSDPEAAVNLMLAAMEGVKLRAVFEPEIAVQEQQAAIVEGLLGILGAAPHVTGKFEAFPIEAREKDDA
jgi:AcrR family transcriptional regulator